MNNSLRELIDHLEDSGVLKSENIKQALLGVDRRKYVPARLEELAYSDSPLVLAEGQTISQPTTVVFMLELLGLQSGHKVLDIGGGSGWVSALMGYLVGPKGHIYAYEINDVIGMIGQENIEKNGVKNVTYKIIHAAQAWDDNAPYDRIHSGAAFKELPMDLKQKLAIGGIMVAPTQDGYVKKITRISETEFEEEEHYGFAFVPFVE